MFGKLWQHIYKGEDGAVHSYQIRDNIPFSIKDGVLVTKNILLLGKYQLVDLIIRSHTLVDHLHIKRGATPSMVNQPKEVFILFMGQFQMSR